MRDKGSDTCLKLMSVWTNKTIALFALDVVRFTILRIVIGILVLVSSVER